MITAITSLRTCLHQHPSVDFAHMHREHQRMPPSRSRPRPDSTPKARQAAAQQLRPSRPHTPHDNEGRDPWGKAVRHTAHLYPPHIKLIAATLHCPSTGEMQNIHRTPFYIKCDAMRWMQCVDANPGGLLFVAAPPHQQRRSSSFPLRRPRHQWPAHHHKTDAPTQQVPPSRCQHKGQYTKAVQGLASPASSRCRPFLVL